MEGIEYLSLLPPWNGRGGFGLDNIIPVLNALGNPQDQVPTVHVAGTNGKGSVSCATASILSAAGHRVGMTISPHLSRLNERIVIDGAEIADADLNGSLLKVKKAVEEIGSSLTFHEAITAASFVAFVDLGCTYAVVEVGLGGTYDATNVISRPKACAVVSLSYDHTDILGSSMLEITAAKAGIIKTGASVVVGALPKESLGFISRHCNDLGCELSCFGINFNIEATGEGLNYRDDLSQFPICLALRGDHQLNNMGIAIRIARLLGATEQDCQKGVADCRWPGRAERLSFTPDHDVVFDCAHNVAGIKTLVDVSKELTSSKRIIVFGALETKDWQEMVDILIPIGSRWIILRPDSSRAVDNLKICEYLKSEGQEVENLESEYEEVATRIVSCAGEWLVSGSIYMVGKLRSLVVTEPERFWPAKNEASRDENVVS